MTSPLKLGCVDYGTSSLTSDEIATVAEDDLFICWFTMSNANLGSAKAINANLKVLGYKNAIRSQPGDDDWDTVNANESWFMHNSSGTTSAYRIPFPGGGYLMDPSSSGWRTHIKDYLNTKFAALSNYDGAMLDDYWNSLEARINWGMFSGVTFNSSDVSDFHANMIAYIQYLAANVTVGKLLVVNTEEYSTDDYVSECDGRIDETPFSTPWYGVSYVANMASWNDFLGHADAMARDTAAGKIVVIVGGANDFDDISASELSAFIDWCYAAALLGCDSDYSYLILWDYNWSLYHPSGSPYGVAGYYVIESTTNHQPTLLDLGAPSGAYSSSSGAYKREFATGIMVFNQDSVAHTVALGGTYYINGTPYTSIDAQAYSGYVLTGTPTASGFGTNTVGSQSTIFSDKVKSTKYTADKTGNLHSIFLYMEGSGAGRHAKVGLHSNDAGSPDDLLGESSSEEITSDGWHEFDLSALAIPITLAVDYWFTVFSDDSNLLWFYEVGGADFATKLGTYPTLPDPFGTPASTGNYTTSIYATIDEPAAAEGTWVSGKYTLAASLTSTTNHFRVPYAASLDGFDELTVLAWVKLNAITDGFIVDKSSGDWGSASGDGAFALAVHDSLITFFVHTTAGEFELNSSGFTLSTDTWIFVAGRFKRNKPMLLYQDGNWVKSGIDTLVGDYALTLNAPITIGMNSTGDGDYLDGAVCELMIFNRGLSIAELDYIREMKRNRSSHLVDRSKQRDKVVAEGSDISGNDIEATAGEGVSVTTVRKIEPTDEDTLRLYAEKTLADLNNDTVENPVELPIDVAVFMKPGDSYPQHSTLLRADSIPRIKRITLSATRASVEFDKAAVLYPSTIKALIELTQQAPTRSGYRYTKSNDEPTSPTPVAGDKWFDLANNIEKTYDGSAWKTPTWT